MLFFSSFLFFLIIFLFLLKLFEYLLNYSLIPFFLYKLKQSYHLTFLISFNFFFLFYNSFLTISNIIFSSSLSSSPSSSSSSTSSSPSSSSSSSSLPFNLINSINKFLHFNFQFDEIFILKVKLNLFPKILVEINELKIKGYSLSPSEWNWNIIEKTLSENRLDIIDLITNNIIKKLTSLCKNEVVLSYFNLPLFIVDIIIANVSLKITSISVEFCARRSGHIDDVTLKVEMEELIVTPTRNYYKLLFTPMFEMDVNIKNISVTSCCYKLDKTKNLPIIPPLLYPVCITGSIVLPKIITQMIQKRPLPSKYCQLNLKASHLTIDFCALNAIEVLNFA